MKDERRAMYELGFRWNKLKGPDRYRWQRKDMFVWELKGGNEWVGRWRKQGLNMHDPRAREDARDWTTRDSQVLSSPVAVVLELELTR